MAAITPLCRGSLRWSLVLLLVGGLCHASMRDSLAQTDTQERVEHLIEQLDDQSRTRHNNAAHTLVRIGPAAVGPLVGALGDENENVREEAAWVLGQIGPAAVDSLIGALGDESADVRVGAATALGEMGQKAAPAAVEPLTGVLGDESEDARWRAAWALVQIGPEAVPAAQALAKALGDESGRVRSRAAEALGRIGPEAAPAAVEPLIGALGDEHDLVHERAVEALGRIGPAAVEPLIGALADESGRVCSGAAQALLRIEVSQYDERETGQLPLFEKAYAIIDEHELLSDDERSEFERILIALQERKALEEDRLINQAKTWIQGHPVIFLIALFYVALLMLCLVLLGLRPLWLLTINQKLKTIEGNFSIKISGFTLVFPLRHALVVGFFHYHRRVLDSWITHHLDTARESFRNLRTVSERAVHVPLPTKIDGELTEENFSSADMRPVFSKNIACVLIQGEGGSGKTSLACQMGRWAMRGDPDERLAPSHLTLPVLVEENFDDFLGAVNARLQSLVDETRPVADDLLLQLLRHRRVLVIVDHLSELSERTREAFQPEASDFPANALIITSRTPVDTGRPHTLVEPLRIESDLLFEFMGAYLKQRGYRREFKDSEFGPMVGRLSTMVGEREVTVLLAKLYAEQMIAVKEGDVEDLPESIPDLMLSYVNWLNREAGPDDPGNAQVQRLAKPLAWRCLKETYRPAPIRRNEVQDLLEESGEDEAILDYFKNELGLIQPVGPAADQIQFSLDPLVEYLAALHVVDKAGGHEEDWQRFIEEAESKEGAPEAMKGFLLAVRDCCIHPIYGQEVPAFVPEELALRAGLDPEVEERLRRKQRVRRLVGDLSRPSAEDREHAAEALGRAGPEAALAVDDLIRTLNDETENVNVHVAVAEALGRIGPEAAPAVEVLTKRVIDENEDIKVRHTATEALGRIGPEAAPAVEVLIKRVNDETEDIRVRSAAAESLIQVLSEIGPEAVQAAVNPLIGSLGDQRVPVRYRAAMALGQMGPAAVIPLIETLSDASPQVRGHAAFALGQIGPQAAPEAVDPLIGALGDENTGVRESAARALGQIGSEAAPAADALTEALDDESESVHTAAARALQLINSKS